ncbi:heme exporter protein CcmD [Chromohalobacter japonicus]|uniref:heme exporter protein CcmD n=1 Tax=Chromohalobacter japonicus TaxID=223900 RepID=UPI001FF3A0E4|nr:heme exporter protein CcmD [Chromohalobacter japonicus]MCK0754295.1 heme exporter protein CcmD [Chromohalobacter japonicus]
MAFDSFHGFLTMHGYAEYVWPAWGMAVLLMSGLVIAARSERRRLIARLKRRQRQAGEA